MKRCEEHDINEWACVIHPRNGKLVHFQRAYRGGRLDFTGSQLHGAQDPLETIGERPCSDGLGRLYPFAHWHPHNGAGVCVRCGQTVDPAAQPVAHGYAAPETEGPTPMSKPDASPVQHQVSYEVGVLAQAPADGWPEGAPVPNARTSCTCGQLDTGLVGSDEAWRAAQEHVKQELPGVDWGPTP